MTKTTLVRRDPSRLKDHGCLSVTELQDSCLNSENRNLLDEDQNSPADQVYSNSLCEEWIGLTLDSIRSGSTESSCYSDRRIVKNGKGNPETSEGSEDDEGKSVADDLCEPKKVSMLFSERLSSATLDRRFEPTHSIIPDKIMQTPPRM